MGVHDSYRWVSCVDAARRLDLRLRDLYRAVDAGRVPAYRIDGQIKLRQHEVERFETERLGRVGRGRGGDLPQ